MSSSFSFNYRYNLELWVISLVQNHVFSFFLVGCLPPGGRVTRFHHFTQFLLTYYPLFTLSRPPTVPFFVLSDFSFDDSINSDGKFFQLFSSLLLYLFFPHCCSVFFPDWTRVHPSCQCPVPRSPLCPGKQAFRRHLGNIPSSMERESPMGFFKLFWGLPEAHYHFCPHLPLTTLESSWAQTPVQEGWALVLWESQCSVCWGKITQCAIRHGILWL